MRPVRINADEEALRLRFLARRACVRVDGEDIDPAADRNSYGLRCRVYATPAGLAGTPPDDLILAAVRRARGAG